MRPFKWSEEELGILETLYARGNKELIRKELKKRPWAVIREQAENMGLKRLIKDIGRPRKKPRVSISKTELAELLVKPDLTVDDIAKKLKTTPDVVRRSIFKYGF